MKSLSDTFIGRALGLLADLVIRHRWLFYWPQFVLLAVCVIYTVFHFDFDPDRDNLVGSDKAYHQIYLKYRKEFPAQDDLVVVVQSENLEKNRQFVERLGHKLEAETNYFTDIFYKGDLSMMGRKAMLFVPDDDLRDIQTTLHGFLPFIKEFTGATNLNSLFALINSQIYHAKREANAENDALFKAMPMLTRIANQATESLHRQGAPPSPGIEALFGVDENALTNLYITYAKGTIFLVTARARSDEMNAPAIERLRFLASKTLQEIPGLNVGITGEPVLEVDEMNQSQKDSALASIVSLVICALIFIYGYQETWRPLKATLCLLVGLGYTMAFTMLVVGHLNILTITFFPILIGLAIDFGVHLITRYEEELQRGRTEEAAMRIAMVYTGQGIFTGAMTTAAAFLAMWLTNFKGIQEMGVICGGGMIICFIPMMTLLPVMLFSRPGKAKIREHKPVTDSPFRARIENAWLKRPKTICVLTLVLTGLALTQFHKVYFDYDLLNMQSAGLPSVIYEKKLIASTPQSLLFAAVVADSPQQAVELEAKLSKLKTVGTNISMASFLTEDATQKLKIIGEIKNEIAPVVFQPTDTNGVNLEQLSQTVYFTQGYMGLAADEVRQEATNQPAPVQLDSPTKTDQVTTNAASTTNDDLALADQLTTLKNSLNELRKQMLMMEPKQASQKLAGFQQVLFNDVRDTFKAIRDQDNSSPLHESDLPPALRDRFVSTNGTKYLIQVYPKDDVWRHDVQEKFVKEVRTVYPNVTGTPVQLYEYTTLLKDSYIQAAYYALGVIAVMVLIHFRSVRYLILSLLPVAIGTIWMGGLMGLFNIQFNPANIMTLPLVIGIGVTNGIHILNRFVEEKNPSILSKSTGKAVFVSGLTTLSGFGSLILGKHQGIRSLGEVMAMGVALCMVAALMFLPAVLNMWGASLVGAKKQPSGDNARSTLGREEPR